MYQASRSVRPLAALFIAGALIVGARPLAAQAPAPPKPAPAKPRPAPPKSATPAPAKPAPAAPVAVAKAPTPPPPQDVRFKSVYTTGEMKTEGVTYIKGERERFEFQDMVLLRQHDQKRMIQISKAANTYMVVPEGVSEMPVIPGAAPSAPPKPAGVVAVSTTIVDTGERKTAFGTQARHVKMAIDKQPAPGACDTSKQRIETDGWYIDAPKAINGQPAASNQTPAPPGGCADQIQATSNGDPKVLGFPIAYTTTITGDDGKPIVAKMEVTEFEATTLDAALFEIPPGMNAALNVRDLAKALSDANEVKLAADNAAPASAASALGPKAPGVVRIGVPELTNKTTQAVDTRALRQRLITGLAGPKSEAVPMATASPADLQKRAADLGYDYLLLAEVSELKASKPGAFGGLMKAASGVAGGRGGAAGAAAGAAGAAAAPKENTESSIAIKLLQPDGKQRLSTTAKGKDGGGFNLQTGLGLAKFAGGMYMSMMTGGMMMSPFGGMGVANLGGMGMLGNPALYRMQAGGLGGTGRGAGLDATAGAASYLIQNAMTMNDLGGFVGVPGQGPSYDESLGEALQNASKAVQKALQQK
jgi:hypothetical protein